MLAAVMLSLMGYVFVLLFFNAQLDIRLVVGVAAVVGGSLGALFPHLAGRAWSLVADSVEAILTAMV